MIFASILSTGCPKSTVTTKTERLAVFDIHAFSNTEMIGKYRNIPSTSIMYNITVENDKHDKSIITVYFGAIELDVGDGDPMYMVTEYYEGGVKSRVLHIRNHYDIKY